MEAELKTEENAVEKRAKARTRSESGQTLMEYIMLVVLIGTASIVAARSFGTEVRRQIKEAKDRIASWRSGQSASE